MGNLPLVSLPSQVPPRGAGLTPEEYEVVAINWMKSQGVSFADMNMFITALNNYVVDLNATDRQLLIDAINAAAEGQQIKSDVLAIALGNFPDAIWATRSEAEFNALAQAERDAADRSGFIDFGGSTTVNGRIIVNKGLTANLGATSLNGFWLGYSLNSSAKDSPVCKISGVRHKLESINNSLQNDIKLPPAGTIFPAGTSTTGTAQEKLLISEGICIEHADATNSGLVTNGTFDTDTTGWTAGNSATLTSASGELEVKSDTAIDHPYASTTVTTTVGEAYFLEFSAYKGTMPSWDVLVGNSIYSGAILNSDEYTNAASKQFRFEFTATATTTYIAFRAFGTYSEATAYFDNISVIPKIIVERADFTYIKTTEIDSSVLDFLPPFGNRHYLGDDLDGLTGIAPATFAGKERYGLFGNWQVDNAIVTKGYKPSLLSVAQLATCTNNIDNNAYISKTGVLMYRDYQVVTEVGMKGEKTPSELFTSKGYTLVDGASNLWTDGVSYYKPMTSTSRLNRGAYHPIYNKSGTSFSRLIIAGNPDRTTWHNSNYGISDGISNGKFLPRSVCDCFDSTWGYTLGGSISDGTTGARPDNKFYDAIYADGENGIVDYRLSIYDHTRKSAKELAQNFIDGIARGAESSWGMLATSTVASDATGGLNNYFSLSDDVTGSVKIGDTAIVIARDASNLNPQRYSTIIYEISSLHIRASLDGSTTNHFASRKVGDAVSFIKQSEGLMSGTMLHVEAIGDLSSYPQEYIDAMANGYNLGFVANLVDDQGNSNIPTGSAQDFKLNRKCENWIKSIYTDDMGVNWGVVTSGNRLDWESSTNSANLTQPVGRFELVFYKTPCNSLEPTLNTKVLDTGDVLITSDKDQSAFIQSVINKVPVGSESTYFSKDKYNLNNDVIAGIDYAGSDLTASDVALASVPSKTADGVQFNTRELKHNGANWGDSVIKIVATDDVDTETDDNSASVLIATKRNILKSDLV